MNTPNRVHNIDKLDDDDYDNYDNDSSMQLKTVFIYVLTQQTKCQSWSKQAQTNAG
jgi:hypothetical protein